MADPHAQVAKGTAASIPLGIVLTKLAGSATLGGLLTMVVTMESDNAAHNEAMAKMRMINDFIFENFPGVVDKYRYCLYGVGWPCTGWQYQAKDAKRYSEIYTKIESLLADPYEFH